MQYIKRKTINTSGSEIPNHEEKISDDRKKDIPSVDEKVRLISDEPLKLEELSKSSLNFEYSKTLAEIIEFSPLKFSIGIFGGWGSGKTSLMKMILNNLKSKENIVAIWFNAWKYEKDKYLAVIPLLKLIEVELHNRNNRKLKTLKNGVEKTFRAFADSISITAGLGDYGSVVINLNKFLKSLRGSTEINGEVVKYYSHPTEHLQESLRKLKFSYKIVVFIDDLDRCMPDRAIEVLESVKSFFDIEGIVFVIGMDYISIDDLIRAKYGKDSSITGREYLEKIVQLPFYIPHWNDPELESLVKSIISSETEGSNLLNEFKDNESEKLVVSAIRKNPRDAKRFINSIILTKTVFGKIKGFKIDKLIAVQALRYREEWNKFLEIIRSNDNSRKKFFEEYIKLKNGNDFNVFTKEVNKIFPNLLEAYNSILKEDDPLRMFLDSGAAEKLRDIEKINPYLIALSSTDKPISSVQTITLRLNSDKNKVKVGEELEIRALVFNDRGLPVDGVAVFFYIEDTSIAEVIPSNTKTIFTDNGIASINVIGRKEGKTKLNAQGTLEIYNIQVDVKRRIVNQNSLDIVITS